MFERLVLAAESHWSKRSGDSQSCCGPRVKEEEQLGVVEKKITFHRLGSKVQEFDDVDTSLAGRVHDGDVAQVLMADNYGVVKGGEEGGTLHHHHDTTMADDQYAPTASSSDSDDSLEELLRRGRAGLVQSLQQERRLLGRGNSTMIGIDGALNGLVHLPFEASQQSRRIRRSGLTSSVAGQDEGGLDQEQQRRLQRYASDLSFNDPGRFWPEKFEKNMSATFSDASADDGLATVGGHLMSLRS
eukprot:CAMPEP_0170627662 /NCGR_PEP_ID=MMETSP0224-20130122/32115_1 /TAXON_ID=285029 /ORGANISM="Togula jolla, Strain CCCM 725" /LENGTH=243 /DNA_ID=CAMNT_0010954725 /DNA_START=84 /DNA_END=815 /DNA_ORIENTATION=+